MCHEFVEPRKGALSSAIEIFIYLVLGCISRSKVRSRDKAFAATHVL